MSDKIPAPLGTSAVSRDTQVDIPAPPGTTARVDQPAPSSEGFLANTAVGRVLDAFGEGASYGWGEGPLGLDPESERELQAAGLFRQGEDGVATPFRAFNEIVLRPAAYSLDLLMRSGEAVATGVAGASGQAVAEITDDQTQGKRFTRDALMLAETLGIASGSAPIFRPRARGAGKTEPVSESPQPGAVISQDTPSVPTVDGPDARPLPNPDENLAGSAPDPVNAAKVGETPVDRGVAGNINLNNLESAEDIDRLIEATANTHRGFEGARRGAMSFDEIAELASQTGLTMDEFMSRSPRGATMNAEQLLASRDLLVKATEEVQDLARKVRNGDNSDGSLMDLQAAITRQVAIQEHVAGATAEAGRALSSLRIIAQSTRDADAVADFMRQRGGRDSLQDVADALADINDPAALSRTMRKALDPTLRDKFLEIYINGLLSNPTTQVVNFTSNTLVAGMSVVEQSLAGLIGSGRRALLGADDAATLGEIPAQVYGSFHGMIEGVPLGLRTLITEEPSGLFNKIENNRRAIGGVTGRVVRTPGNLLQGQDAFFKAIGYRQELYALAYRQAAREGHSGTARLNRVQQIVSDPTEAMMNKAIRQGEIQTFTNPLGSLGQTVTLALNKVPFGAGRVVVPFIRTPTNIIKFAAKRTPLGLAAKSVRDDIRKGGAEGDLAMARIAVGTGLSAAAYTLALDGVITGGGPVDRNERALKYATGWQPYSILVGDTYYAYGRLEPLGLLMGVAADLAEIQDAASDQEIEEITTALAVAAAKNLTSKTWLQGPAEMISALQDPTRYGDQYIKGLIASMIPAGVAQVARQVDPVMRDTNTMMETIKSRLPFLSQGLLPRRDIWGEPIVRQGGVGPDIASPVYTSRLKDDPVSQELLSIQVTPSQLRDTIENVKLTPEQYDEYQRVAGRLARVAVSNLVLQPGWQNVPLSIKRDVVDKQFSQARRQARTYMKLKFPELITEAARIKLEEYGLTPDQINQTLPTE